MRSCCFAALIGWFCFCCWSLWIFCGVAVAAAVVVVVVVVAAAVAAAAVGLW